MLACFDSGVHPRFITGDNVSQKRVVLFLTFSQETLTPVNGSIFAQMSKGEEPTWRTLS
jgi:hypothetical protein